MAIGTSAIIGGALGLGGSLLSSRSQDRATDAAVEASQFRPFNIGGDVGGAVGFNNFTNTAFANLDPTTAAIRDVMGMSSLGSLLGNAGTDGVAAAQSAAGQSMQGGLLQALLAQEQGLEQQVGAREDFEQSLGGLMGQFQGIQNNFQQQSTAQGVADNLANFASTQGQGLLGQDLRGTVQSTLDNLRQQARPQEERAVDSRIQDLFSRGTLSSTSGARSLGELSLAQENADISRQLQAEQLGLQQFGANQNAGQGLLSLGGNLLTQGRQLNQGLAGQQASLGLQGLGQQGGFLSQLLGSQVQGGNEIAGTGNQRLSTLQNLFGFGQQTQGNDLNQALAGLGGRLNINTDLRNLVALGGNIGGQQASAGATQAQALMNNNQNPLGAFLSGIGGGLLTSSQGGG